MFAFKLASALFDLTRSCEVRCVTACCGLDALDIRACHLGTWMAEVGVARTLEALDQLEALAHAVGGQRGPISSDADDFAASWESPRDCLDFLKRWHEESIQALLPLAGGLLFQHEWLSANGGAGRSLLRATIQTGDFANLPILADALEEAGCQNAALLSHCRQSAPHARPCWVLDLLTAGEALGAMPLRTTLPRRNRVTPLGNLVAVAARGTLMGNRGCLHDEQQRIQRDYNGQRWILCQLSFKGRQRTLMTPGRYTELFFLDEATGLSAGHRPCAECQRARYNSFRDAWVRGNPKRARGSTRTAEQLDAALQRERRNPGPYRSTYEEALANLPTGVMVLSKDEPHLVHFGQLRAWRPEGYGPPVTLPAGSRVHVLTPRSIVNAISQGYAVDIHPSARS